MKEQFSGVILLTGASGGLGLGVAECLLAAGYRNLALHYRSRPEHLRELAKRYDLPEEAHLFQADLSDESAVRSLREGVEKRLGSVSALVNLAGASSNGMSWKLSLADFRAILDANLTSTFLCCREFIPAMRAAGGGRIVNTSSVVGFTGVAGASHYCAAKAGIVGLTKALALELANKGITVNALALGYFDQGLIESVPQEMRERLQKQIPMGRFGNCEEIFASLEYLLGKGGAYTTGQVMHINGGLYL